MTSCFVYRFSSWVTTQNTARFRAPPLEQDPTYPTHPTPIPSRSMRIDGAAGSGPWASASGSTVPAINSVNAASGSKRKGVSTGNSNGGKKSSTRVGDGDDFVFVLNPELDWDDVNVDTRVRMKTLVAETMDIFERKYSKRKVHEWEKKVQKYRPPNSVDGRTYNVPLGNVVRGIQETFYRQEAGARRAALEHDKSVGVGTGGKRVKQNVPTTPSPPRELS